MLTADSITDEQIRELFARHCECRPLNTARISHSHDCDTLYTDECRLALHAFTVGDHTIADGRDVALHRLHQDYKHAAEHVADDWPCAASSADQRAARARCAEILNSRPLRSQ